MNWYYKVLIRRPLLIIIAISILSLACIIVSFTVKNIPNFENPTLGFEARGTDIGKRLKTWDYLLHSTGMYGQLVANPNDLLHLHYTKHFTTGKIISHTGNKSKKHKKSNGNRKIENRPLIEENRDIETTTEMGNKHYEFGWNTIGIDDDELQHQVKAKKIKWDNFRKKERPLDIHDATNTNGFFCESPMKEYSHFVFERIDSNKNLFEVNSLLEICQLEDKLISIKNYENFCQKNSTSNQCCRPWSLSNYIALLANKTSCFDIDQNDIDSVELLLLNCYEYFSNLKLTNDCSENRCRVPIQCTRYNAVFNILNYLVDINFVRLNESNVFLKHSIIFIPIAQSTKILQLFKELQKSNLKTESLQVVAMELGLKQALFDEYLLLDGWLIGFGGLFVMGCMWIYTASLFATIMTVIAVMFSLGIAYFIYTIIFELTFFPFMNLLAVIVLVGIGADDAFIFVKIWQSTLSDHIKKDQTTANRFSETNETEILINLMALTFQHAALSIFVTSITTAGAFFTSYISSITAVRCFGIFAGTAIITNYLFMVTWLPASISIMEGITFDCRRFLPKNLFINDFYTTLKDYIFKAVIHMPILWIIVFGSTGIASCFIVLYWPKLQLPESNEFQLFTSDHPFELYDSKYKNFFWFQKNSILIDHLPMRFVWGLLPIDDGDYLNPHSRGKLYFDNNLNISSMESQEWLLNFCKKLKSKPFYQFSAFGLLLPNCFIENFISWMNRKCVDAMDNADRTPCCEISKFPFEPNIFEQCLPQSITSLYATPREFFIPGVAGPKFLSTKYDSKSLLKFLNNERANSSELSTNNLIIAPPEVKVIVIEFESNFLYSMSYVEVEKFVNIVQKWFDEEMLSAPAGMKGGWFISELDFFNLQDSLSRGTIIAITTAMCASLLVLLFVTLNVLISLYAVVTVTLTIFTTVAILVLLGWKLNILESISVSTAIGLAVDFSLHYCIQYRLSNTNNDRISSTKFALSQIIGPTAMAALTTGMAGVFMLFSKILPYIQIGIFLIIVMSTSWIYATFFLMSLLRVIGPQNNFMQLNYSIFSRKIMNKNLFNSKSLNERQNIGKITNKQLLTPTSSAVGDILNSESHELDSLTSDSIIKQISDVSKLSVDLSSLNVKPTNLNDFRNMSGGSVDSMLLGDSEREIIPSQIAK